MNYDADVFVAKGKFIGYKCLKIETQRVFAALLTTWEKTAAMMVHRIIENVLK